MTKLVWDKVNERPFEFGVDRGVLNGPSNLVLPWNGLISVDEVEINESEFRPQLDGETYANFQFGGVYQCVVKAFSFPYAFSEIIGIKDFSFRTSIEDVGYKLHFVHNALASQTKQQAKTLSDKTEAEIFEWLINATPPQQTSIKFKPSSHMVVNSLNVDAASLTELENLLYGTALVNPVFPTQQDIIDLVGV
jgi:hypothetical protein